MPLIEIVISLAGSVLGEGARFTLEQWFLKSVRFGVEVSAYEKAEYSYKSRRVYILDIKPIVTGPYEIKVIELADGSGDGTVFFPSMIKAYDPPIIGLYSAPNLAKPSSGSISLDQLPSNGNKFTTYVATEKPQEYVYIDVRYVVMNERQTESRALIRFRALDNR